MNNSLKYHEMYEKKPGLQDIWLFIKPLTVKHADYRRFHMYINLYDCVEIKIFLVVRIFDTFILKDLVNNIE